MKVDFWGGTQLADTLAHAARRRGFDTEAFGDLVVIAAEVYDHGDLDAVDWLMGTAVSDLPVSVPVVVTSQVPPGWTRKWERPNVFYQPHTLINGREASMAYSPTILVVGCADPTQPLPGAYVKYLSAFEAPIHRVGYEAAELSKLALNYFLASQVEAANKLSKIASSLRVDWEEDIMPALRADPRVGKHAYIRPGVVGGHLPRDVKTIERLSA